MKKYLIYGVVAVLFVALGAYFGTRASEPPAATKITAQSPGSAVAQLLAQTLPDAQGQPQSLSKWQGKALVVNFWAPWCPPCVQEMPELSALHTEMAAKNIHVIGIGIDTQAHITEFAGKYKISYPLYVAGMGGTELERQMGNPSGGLPFTVLIGADGQIRKTYLGTIKFDQLRADMAAM